MFTVRATMPRLELELCQRVQVYMAVARLMEYSGKDSSAEYLGTSLQLVMIRLMPIPQECLVKDSKILLGLCVYAFVD